MTHIVRTAIRCNGCEHISEDPEEFVAYTIATRNGVRKLDLCADCREVFTTWWDCGDAKSEKSKGTVKPENISCIKCGYTSDARGIENHSRGCNPNTKRMVDGKNICAVCGRESSSWVALGQHVRTQHQKKVA